jgi:hypothetical protein
MVTFSVHFVRYHATKTWRSELLSPRNLNFVIRRCVRGQLEEPTALPPDKYPPAPIHEDELHYFYGLSESRGEKKNSAPACYWTPISCSSSPCSSHYTYRVPINICTHVIYDFGNVSNITRVWRNFYFNSATAPSGPGTPHYWSFTITLRHTTLGRTPLDGWSARGRDLYLTTHNTHKRQTSVSSGGIPTRNTSKQAAADLRP